MDLGSGILLKTFKLKVLFIIRFHIVLTIIWRDFTSLGWDCNFLKDWQKWVSELRVICYESGRVVFSFESEKHSDTALIHTNVGMILTVPGYAAEIFCRISNKKFSVFYKNYLKMFKIYTKKNTRLPKIMFPFSKDSNKFTYFSASFASIYSYPTCLSFTRNNRE